MFQLEIMYATCRLFPPWHRLSAVSRRKTNGFGRIDISIIRTHIYYNRLKLLKLKITILGIYFVVFVFYNSNHETCVVFSVGSRNGSVRKRYLSSIHYITVLGISLNYKVNLKVKRTWINRPVKRVISFFLFSMTVLNLINRFYFKINYLYIWLATFFKRVNQIYST